MDSDFLKGTLVFLLAGGQGERLYPLTKDRSKPAVPFGGIYRIIDFSLSNCLNSDLRKIIVLTQYKSLSLDRHIKTAWNLMSREMDYYIDVVPPQQRIDNNWYGGTADAIFQNVYVIEMERPDYVLILSGDHVYKMDYRKMLQYHIDRDADMTIAAAEIGLEEATRFGVLAVNSENRVIGFDEKPGNPRPVPDKPGVAAKIFNTICDSTYRRQEEVLALARKVEAIVVVGGKGSGNTRRLARISEEAGVPTFHVETEKDLDLQALSGYAVIGVTAGASTPNWLILRVVDRIHELRGRGGAASRAEMLGRLAAISYLLLGFGAGCLTYASVLLQGLPLELSSVFIAALYVFSMHVLNRLADKASENFNQPGRSEFYRRYGTWMVSAGIASAVLALALAWFEGLFPFLLLLAISALGMIYNLRLLPGRSRSRFHYQKLKDLPGSKTLLVALAWGVVTSLLPPLAQEGRLLPATLVAFLYSSILVFVRSTLYDFKDIQGDLMVGKETIPIVLGQEKTETLVVLLLIFLGAALTAAATLEWTTSLASVLLISLGYVVSYYYLYRQKITAWGFLFEWAVDGSFIFAGFLAFLWAMA